VDLISTRHQFKADGAKLQVLATLLTIITGLHNSDYLIGD
jgi:hypothetical protein